MKIKFTADAFLNLATAEGPIEHRHSAGDTVNLPEDIAALFLAQGVAEPIAAERATKTKGETADK